MSVLDPRELQASPLADLHALAAELGLEGFRRLRKADLIDQIIKAGGGTPAPAAADEPETALHEDAAGEPEEGDAEWRAPSQNEDDAEDLHEGSTGDVPRSYQEPMPNWEQQRQESSDDDDESDDEGGSDS